MGFYPNRLDSKQDNGGIRVKVSSYKRSFIVRNTGIEPVPSRNSELLGSNFPKTPNPRTTEPSQLSRDAEVLTGLLTARAEP